MKLAWSEAFEPGKLGSVAPLALDGPITREWAWGDSSGAGVRVAVIDSGIDASHPLVGQVHSSVILQHDPSAAGEVSITEAEHEDVFGHGTACAAIIRSLAPDCELHSIRVLGTNLRARGTVFAAGLRWAIEQGMHVVNMSLSSRKADYYGLFHELVDLASFRRVMLVCAANNVPAPTYPAEFSGVFSVAAHAGRDPRRFDYNPAPPVEFGAPGIDVEVAWTGGKTIQSSGNSFAAPHIAGLVALILGKHPGLAPFEVKTILHALADNAASA